MRDRVAVDFDGMLAEHAGWRGHEHKGRVFDGAREFCAALQAENIEVMIFTSRLCEEFTTTEIKRKAEKRRLEEFLDEHKIPYDSVWLGIGKPACLAYVDDRGVHCDPARDPSAYARALHHIRELRKRPI